ncbi:MAG: glycerol-3-phosphate dehydrogenase/oxidase [Candidatus Binatia bacterium]
MADSFFSRASRAKDLAAMAAERVDLLIIGGGITGAGIARDAALRGLRVALVERRDFASGTSSRSSKLIHGGVRYLRQGDIGLVLEAAEERRILRRIAPHLTQPRPMLIPAYGLGMHTKLNVGLWTYEKLAGIGADERHEMLGRQGALAREPGLRADGLHGAAVYPENVTDDARLVLATLQSAKRSGGLIANYAEVCALSLNGASSSVAVRDLEHSRVLQVRARIVINASGPWSDLVRALEAPASRTLHLTKGIHFVVRREDLPIHDMVVAQADDKRQIFAVPRGGIVYVGTTDTDYGAPADYPEVTRHDVEYLISALRRVFPSLGWGAESVLSAWAGLRPLVHEPGKRPSEISRKHEIVIGPKGMISVAGGKLTTYRRMAEKVVDLAANRLGAAAESTTAHAMLEGGDLPAAPREYGEGLASRFEPALPGLAQAVDRLVLHHGSGAEALLERAVGAGTGFLPGRAALEVEVDHAVESEMAMHLCDVLERRLRLLLFTPDRGLGVTETVADRMATLLGWDRRQRDREIAEYQRIAAASAPV